MTEENIKETLSHLERKICIMPKFKEENPYFAKNSKG